MTDRRRAVGQLNRHGLPILELAYEAFWKRELYFERRHGRDPEQTVADRNFLSHADVAAGDDTVKGSGDPGFFLFQFKRLLGGFCVAQEFGLAADFELVRFHLVLRVFQRLLGEDTRFPEFLRTAQI